MYGIFDTYKVVIIGALLAWALVFESYSSEDQASVEIELYNDGHEDLIVYSESLQESGVLLKPQATISMKVLDDFSGTFWAKSLKCCLNDIEFPATIAGISLGVLIDDATGEIADIYGVSLVDGYNRGITIIPVGNVNCSQSSCSFDLEENCPERDKILDDDGSKVACMTGVKEFRELCPDAVASEEDELNYCQSIKYGIIFE